MSAVQKNVLLINPWITDFVAYDFWLKPLGLLYVGSALKQNGYSVYLLDCMDRFHQSAPLSQRKSKPDGTGKFYKEIIQKPQILQHVPRRFGRYGLPKHIVIRELKKISVPDVIFITSGMTYWYSGVYEMIETVKDLFPNTPVVLGGIYATLCTEHAEEYSGADYVIKGRGEIQGLKIADELTETVRPAGFYDSVDDTIFPAYDLYKELPSAAVITSRGCPYSCPFCASRILEPHYTRQNPEKSADQIIRLAKEFGTKHIAFYDDALLLEKEKYFVPMLEKIDNLNLNIAFHTPNGLQPSQIDKSVAMLMKRAGFQTIRLSYETINPEWQKIMKKVVDSDIANAVSSLLEAGFDRKQIGAYIMMGLPRQKPEEVARSMIFILQQGIKVSLAAFSPIHGTRLFSEMVEENIINKDIDPLLTNNSVFPTKGYGMQREDFITLGTVAAEANTLINNNLNPLENRSWVKKIEKIIK
ncbi:radical SAM protein [candidate division KSB1 bacterium]|nr:MAG: radical SAM protein [candidate division KSB1 bacterium]